METHNNPITIFFLWIVETIFTIMVSINFHFDLNEFRVWSLWLLSVMLGAMQFILHRKSLKQNIIQWWDEIKKSFTKK